MLTYPSLLQLTNEAAYRRHFENIYCQRSTATFDGIQVTFRKDDFDHCCFESSKRNGVKDTFSQMRAERLDWIGLTLRDPNSERYQGWDSNRKCYDATRRVALVMGNYVVVISRIDICKKTARFVTAYVADTPNSLRKIKSSPKWQ